MKHYYLEVDLIEYPLGLEPGQLRVQYQKVKTIYLKSFEDEQTQEEPDTAELVLIVTLIGEYIGPATLNEIKYGRSGDKEWTVLTEEDASQFYEKLKPVLDKNPRVITPDELEIFKPFLGGSEGDEHLNEVILV